MTERKPCKECPFTKGGPLGGASPFKYLGQAYGPFFLPCHLDPKYEENKRNPELLQCAGAAIFRANAGVADKMPDGLLRLPPGDERVYGSPEELLAGMFGYQIEEARKFLAAVPPTLLCVFEMGSAEVTLVDIGKPGPDGKPKD